MLRRNHPIELVRLLIGCAALALAFAASPAAAFTIDMPDEIRALTPEQQLEWINRQTEPAATEQLRVGVERETQRMAEKRAVSTEMALESARRRAHIREAQAAVATRQEHAAQTGRLLTFALLAVVCPAVGLAGWRRWRERREADLFDEAWLSGPPPANPATPPAPAAPSAGAPPPGSSAPAPRSAAAPR